MQAEDEQWNVDSRRGSISHTLRVLSSSHSSGVATEAMTVGVLVESLDGNQPNISRHLQILHQAGIVTRRRSGSHIIYFIKHPLVFSLCEFVLRSKRTEGAGVR
jgi:DNA-binding transcriptional ArsR family regulator